MSLVIYTAPRIIHYSDPKFFLEFQLSNAFLKEVPELVYYQVGHCIPTNEKLKRNPIRALISSEHLIDLAIGNNIERDCHFKLESVINKSRINEELIIDFNLISNSSEEPLITDKFEYVPRNDFWIYKKSK